MKIFKNVLSDELIKKLFEEFDSIKYRNVWALSELFWQKELLVDSAGICAQTPVSDELSNMVKNEIKSLLPVHNYFVVQYYCWFKHSGIRAHDDGNRIFGSTIYLNKEWLSEYGGVFTYADEKATKFLIPEYNTMVLNDKKTNHFVSPVTSKAPTFRFTLQIWGN